MKAATIQPTQNVEWGFFGTMSKANRDADTEWKKAFEFIQSLEPKVGGVDVTDNEIRTYLDSKGGRHLADAVIDCGSIEKVNQKWSVVGRGFWFFDVVYAVRKA